jgi:hypothetical protein
MTMSLRAPPLSLRAEGEAIQPSRRPDREGREAEVPGRGPTPEFAILAVGSLPDTVLRLLNPDRHLRVPKDQRFWPVPTYLEYHRTVVFKG